MRLTRNALRKLILKEIRLLTEETEFNEAMAFSKDNPDLKINYYDADGQIVHVLINGLVEKTFTNIRPNTRKYKNFAFAPSGSKTFGFA